MVAARSATPNPQVNHIEAAKVFIRSLDTLNRKSRDYLGTGHLSFIG